MTYRQKLENYITFVVFLFLIGVMIYGFLP